MLPLSSVAVSLRAFLLPVAELTIREYVPSPLFVTVALTPSKLFKACAKSESVLFDSLIVIVWLVLLLFVTKLPDDQSPKSIFIVPVPIVSDLLLKPVSSMSAPQQVMIPISLH